MIRRIITNDVPLFVVSLVVLVLILSACASQPGAVQPPATDPSAGEPTGTPGAVSHGSEVGGYVELVDALRAAGATVEPAGDVDQPFFGDSAQVIKVNGADVQVFEFTGEAAAQAAAGTISANGYIISTTSVDWISQPYFWSKGRVIVLYVGTDAATIELLNGLLGEPLTSPQLAPTGEPGSGSADEGGSAQLMDQLQAAGAAVEPAGEIEQAFFGPIGQVFRVNGADVQVFEYPDEAARMAESEQISPDGATIGTTMVTWVDEPHFWAVGRTIVLYVGSDQVVVDVLNRVLGEPIAE